MKNIILFLILFYLFFLFTPETFAKETEKYITIVNPVRISRYTKTPALSLKNEYSIINKYNLSATWLLTYDALNNKEIIDEVRKMDQAQEIGIFLEITETFASEVGVKYHNSGSWHHANSVFLSGYTQEERKILIDKVFEKYKEIFGNYPKSIGSWWTDGYSLAYIKEKYGIIANLVCSDQFSTDNYELWGQPWQMAYYPRRNHPAVPASNIENKLDLINIQWASRDPLNGYNSSLYSTQDYLVAKDVQNINYFKRLLDLYLNSSDTSQITVGLEADLDPSGYAGEFTKQIEEVKEYSDKGVNIVTMAKFYDKYKEKYSDISPTSQLKSKDLLGSETESSWYNSSFYRLHYTLDLTKNIIQIKDIRIYNEKLIDPYFVSPNNEFNLSINIPSVIDSVQNPEDAWILPKGSEIVTSENSFVIKGKNIKIPKKIKNNPLINLIVSKDQIEINFKPIVFNSNEGETVKGFTSEAMHFFKTKTSILKLVTGNGWNYFNKINYLIPQEEIYALLYLKSLSSGKVMVFDKECLQCSWHTKNKPIVFSNLRTYIKDYSSHPIVYNSSVFNAKTIKEAQKEFKRTRTRYIYLVKFEEYVEKLPFSPGDLGIKKVYSNANAEVWEVE